MKENTDLGKAIDPQMTVSSERSNDIEKNFTAKKTALHFHLCVYVCSQTYLGDGYTCLCMYAPVCVFTHPPLYVFVLETSVFIGLILTKL